MTGILEAFALAEMCSGIGFLVRWRSRLLASKVNYFHPPHNRKSPIDKLVRAPDRTSCYPAGPTLREIGRRPYRPRSQAGHARCLPSTHAGSGSAGLTFASQTLKEEAAMKFNTKGLEWWRWLYLFAIWFLIPGGTLIVLAWLLAQEIQLDKDLSAYYHASFGEFMERKRKQEEAKHDIHPVSDQ